MTAMTAHAEATWQHQGALSELVILLRRHCPEALEVFIGPLNVDLAEDSLLRPDALVVRRDRLGEEQLAGMPELTIEVVSPNTRQFDQVLKHTRYEEAGCPNYWVIDPEAPSIVAWELVDGRYVAAGRAEGDTELTLSRPFPVVVIPARLTD